MELKAAADLMDGFLQEQKINKYTYCVTQSEKQELNLENGGFKLLRTVFNNSGSVKVFLGEKMGAASGNDLTEKGLEKLVQEAKAAAESASDDPCHDIAPDQGKEVFRQGGDEPDMERFIERIKEFLDTTAKEYPKVKIMPAKTMSRYVAARSKDSSGALMTVSRGFLKTMPSTEMRTAAMKTRVVTVPIVRLSSSFFPAPMSCEMIICPPLEKPMHSAVASHDICDDMPTAESPGAPTTRPTMIMSTIE